MNPLETMVWFEKDKRGDNLLWYPSPATMQIVLYLLLEARLKKTHKTHLVMVPLLMTLLWTRQMRKEADLLFTIPVGMHFCVLE